MTKYITVNLESTYPKKKLLIPVENVKMVTAFLSCKVVEEVFDGKRSVLGNSQGRVQLELVELDLDTLEDADTILARRAKKDE